MAGPSPLGGASMSVDDVMIAPGEAQLIRDSCDLLRTNVGHHSLIMFLTIFDVSDEMRDLFWFVRDMDEPAPTNPVLQKHAEAAFRKICDACCQMDSREAVGALLPAMEGLGARHRRYGIKPEHFDVFRMAFLKTVARALGEGWTNEVEAAWGKAYGHVEVMVMSGLGFKPQK